MDVLKNLLSNFPLICVAAAWLLAQLLKIFTGGFREKKKNVIDVLVGTGGMPSSHAASVVSLAVACAISEGVASAAFAISVLFAFVVMRDATGVRRETGEQAKVLNHIVKNLFSSGDHENINRNLRELVGHTPLQVFVGALVGAAVPCLVGMIPYYNIYGVF